MCFILKIEDDDEDDEDEEDDDEFDADNNVADGHEWCVTHVWVILIFSRIDGDRQCWSFPFH